MLSPAELRQKWLPEGVVDLPRLPQTWGEIHVRGVHTDPDSRPLDTGAHAPYHCPMSMPKPTET